VTLDDAVPVPLGGRLTLEEEAQTATLKVTPTILQACDTYDAARVLAFRSPLGAAITVAANLGEHGNRSGR
jgi:hypothetical protein